MIEQNARRGLSVSDFGIVIEVGKVKLEGTGQDLLTNDAVRRAYLGG
jgi:branched-chain amino acid transport system ATP-binding protein